MALSNAEKYNQCNPEKDGYCMFEKQVDDLQHQLEQANKVIDDISETNIILAILDVVNNKEKDLEYYREEFKEDLTKLQLILSQHKQDSNTNHEEV